MCGRFSITKQESDIESRFGVKFYSDKYEPEFNAYPSKSLAVIKNNTKDIADFHKWGLNYNWTKGLIINSRFDKLIKSPVYKGLFKSKRCIIPADGFYEWKKIETKGKKEKIPFRIRLINDSLFALAGLWDECTNKEGEKEICFSIITVEPNILCKEIHNRMPAILEPEHEQIWLDERTEPAELLNILKPFDHKKMDAYRISPLVNNPENNVREILDPVNETEN